MGVCNERKYEVKGIVWEWTGSLEGGAVVGIRLEGGEGDDTVGDSGPELTEECGEGGGGEGCDVGVGVVKVGRGVKRKDGAATDELVGDCNDGE